MKCPLQLTAGYSLHETNMMYKMKDTGALPRVLPLLLQTVYREQFAAD